jgi:hypothetical protein
VKASSESLLPFKRNVKEENRLGTIGDFKIYGSMSRKTRAIQERKNTQSDPFPVAFR